MPFPFTLPTTSLLSFSQHLSSPIYPSLPLLATTHRGRVRNTLKSHKRLPQAQQNSNYPAIIEQLETYISHLFLTYELLQDGTAQPTAIEVKAEWRAPLTSAKFGIEAPRIGRPGLVYEIFWTLSTLAYAYTLSSRSRLLDALSPGESTSSSLPGGKQTLLAQSAAQLLTSASIFSYLVSFPTPENAPTWPIDLAMPVLSALCSMSMADATLLAVLKQDPYPSYLSLTVTTSSSSSSKKNSKEWLYNPPEPPTGVRALLLARLCVAASDHASKALGLLSAPTKRRITIPTGINNPEDKPGEISPELVKYLDSLQKVSKARACRFLGIDAEASGRVGEGISWIRLALGILDIPSLEEKTENPSSSKLKGGLEKLKRDRSEKKEAKSLATGAVTWGMDAGRLDEARVLEALDKKWSLLNDKVSFQPIPPSAGLASRIPSGREIHSLKEWEVPRLGAEEIRGLRNGAEGEDAGLDGFEGLSVESSDEESVGGKGATAAGVGKGKYY